MRRHLPRLVLLGALLSPVTLYALGLGEIRLNSALNQPFNADIELIAASAEELTSLKVGLANNELFSRYGLDRPAFLNSFEFVVSRDRDGRPTIKVTSNRSVTEPFVTLLVEARWARGRLLREYTVLLDPPVFMPTQPEQQAQAPVTTPQAGAQTQRIERQQPAPQPEAEPERPVPSPAAPVAEAREEASTPPPAIAGDYTVQRNDTLWRIASSVTPGGPRTINRTMIALFRANPDAFNGNINRLRSGSVLRIPDIAEIESIPTAEASAEVARQTAEWSGALASQTPEDASRLRLVTPEEAPAAPTAATPTPEQPGQQRPGATPGAPTPEDQRVELPSTALAEAQRGVTETPVQPGDLPPTEATTPETQEPAAETPPAEAEPAPAAPVRRPPSRPAQQEAPGPSLMERIGDYWWVFVGVGLLVVIALALAVVRRRREESSASLDTLAPLNFEPRAVRTAAGAAPAATKARAEAFFVEDTDDDNGLGMVDAAPPVTARRVEPPKRAPVEQALAPKVSDDTLSSETAVRFDQQDALAEADFHMAYGLYDQAADLVKIAIDREPARRDLKLKLLEIYFVWGNKDLFLDTARELHASRAQAAAGEWDKVLIMGRQIAAEDPMFKGEAGAHVDLVDVNLEGGENRVDVDLFAEPEADKPAGLDLEFTSGERQGPAPAASNLDFLLDEPKRGADEEPTREIDQLSRTQETPTIESPMIDRTSQTIREKLERTGAQKAEQTAELSLDDLGLDVDSLEQTGSLEDTTSIEKDPDAPALRDDELTQLAPSVSSFDRTLESPRVEKFDVESTGTIYIDQVDLSGGDTVEQARPETDSTASMKRPDGLSKELDVDLDRLSGAAGPDTVRHHGRGETEADRFSTDVFTDRTAEVPRIDLDVGDPLAADDREPTHKQRTVTNEMELSELEPVTMSEVGTKLDLARAYMDMGDPDGARSILEEVLSEGNPNQKQEAQRLMESIR